MTTVRSEESVPVPGDLLPIMRERVLAAIESVGDRLTHAGRNGCVSVDQACDEVEIIIGVYRALKPESTTYPASVVAVALDFVIEDAASRIADDCVSVDRAEALVRRVRACEALQVQIDPQAATA